MDPAGDTTADRVPPKDDPRPRLRSRCGSCVRAFLAFLFSTVGLTFLLICYSVVGGLVFMRLESANENRTAAAAERRNRTADAMERLRREHLAQLWNMTLGLNVLYPDVWMAEADVILRNYSTLVYTYTTVMGWADAGSARRDDDNQWSFAGSLLYAVTVITTIGRLYVYAARCRKQEISANAHETRDGIGLISYAGFRDQSPVILTKIHSLNPRRSSRRNSLKTRYF